MNPRTAFMGSPEMALPTLEVVRRRSDLRLVVTQPDRPAGRGRRLTPPPVKTLAESWGVPVVQPAKMRDGTLAEQLTALDLDLVVVVAFGRILPPDILGVPRHGCVNLHFSLLPRWRGAAPVQRAVLAGDSVVGVSLMAMDEGLDTGPVYEQTEVVVDALESAGELASRLASIGAQRIDNFLRRFPDLPRPVPQDESRATQAPPLRKDEGVVDWGRSAVAIVNQIRGLDPWPVAVTGRRGAPLKLFRARPGPVASSAEPGQVVAVDAQGMHVACGDGVVIIGEVQPAGRNRMPAETYRRGAPFEPGERLG